MSAPSLTEFLLAQIAEDEAVARAASVGSESWHLDDLSETVLWWPPASPEQVAFIRERMGDDSADRDASWSGQTIEVVGDRIAPHIARHDPARVLADCKAKRRIVEYAQTLDGDGPVPENSRLEGLIRASGWAIRFLAVSYADHPDYQEEWKP